MATWKVFGSRLNENLAVYMFDNDKNTQYLSEDINGENRKIEIIFNEPILFDKLVITDDYYHTKGFKLLNFNSA